MTVYGSGRPHHTIVAVRTTSALFALRESEAVARIEQRIREWQDETAALRGAQGAPGAGPPPDPHRALVLDLSERFVAKYTELRGMLRASGAHIALVCWCWRVTGCDSSSSHAHAVEVHRVFSFQGWAVIAS